MMVTVVQLHEIIYNYKLEIVYIVAIAIMESLNRTKTWYSKNRLTIDLSHLHVFQVAIISIQVYILNKSRLFAICVSDLLIYLFLS